MPKIAHLMSAGFSPSEALRVVGSNFPNGGLTAVGTTKATALLLTDVDNYISVVSASGKGVELIALDQGDECNVYNGGANAMFVYSNGTDTIINHSANAGFNIPTFKSCSFRKVTSSLIMVNLSN